MEKFLAGKPNDQFPKSPPPDREILAKRSEAAAAIRKAQEQEDEANAQATDETADQAKSAAQGEDHGKEPGTGRVPKMVESEPGAPPRSDPARPPKGGREDRPRIDDRTPPSRPPSVIKPDTHQKPPGKEERKRGKNG